MKLLKTWVSFHLGNGICGGKGNKKKELYLKFYTNGPRKELDVLQSWVVHFIPSFWHQQYWYKIMIIKSQFIKNKLCNFITQFLWINHCWNYSVKLNCYSPYFCRILKAKVQYVKKCQPFYTKLYVIWIYLLGHTLFLTQFFFYPVSRSYHHLAKDDSYSRNDSQYLITIV